MDNVSEKLAMKPSGRRRGLLERLLGRVFLFVATVEFLFIGSLVTIVQFLLYLTIGLCRPGGECRRRLKELNCYLMYAEFAPALTVIYKWGNASVNIYAPDSKTLDILKLPDNVKNKDRRQITLVLMNHSYELDYMTSFIMMDQLGQLPLFKLMAKKEISYLPVVGWSLKMCDIVFVKRNWAKDKRHIGSQLDQLLDYKHATFSIYPEGTRFTPEKHKDSVEFSKSRNIEPLRHHLWPKSRGFTYALTHYIKQTKKRNVDLKLINLQCIMPHRCNFFDFLNGRNLSADMFCEEVVISDEIINEALAITDLDYQSSKMLKLLEDVYRRKDEMFDLYMKDNGKSIKQTHFTEIYPSKSRQALCTCLFVIGSIITFTFIGLLVYSIPWSPISFWSTFGMITVLSTLMYNRILSESSINDSKQNLR